MTSLTLLLTLNMFHTFFSVSANFGQVNAFAGLSIFSIKLISSFHAITTFKRLKYLSHIAWERMITIKCKGSSPNFDSINELINFYSP